MNWRSIAFLLESSVFLLIGLQARTIIRDAFSGEASVATVLALCCAAAGGGRGLRLVWVFVSRYLLVRPGADGETGQKPPWTYTFLLGWAGMRGVVTLAAAFVIPPETPHRDVLLLVAFTVTAGTLFIQGLSLPWIARRLRVPSPDPAADALARANLLHQASPAGLAKLDELEEDDPHEVSRDHPRPGTPPRLRRLGAGRRERGREPQRDLLPLAPADDRRRAHPGPGDPQHRHGRRTRWSTRCWRCWTSRSRCWSTATPSAAACAPRRSPRPSRAAAEHLALVRPPVEPDTPGECDDCLRGGHRLGAPADVRGLRPRRLLRLLAAAARQRPPRADRAPGDALGRAGRGLALVLRRRAHRLSTPGGHAGAGFLG